jgi:hypothetical protein
MNTDTDMDTDMDIVATMVDLNGGTPVFNLATDPNPAPDKQRDMVIVCKNEIYEYNPTKKISRLIYFWKSGSGRSPMIPVYFTSMAGVKRFISSNKMDGKLGTDFYINHVMYAHGSNPKRIV